MIKGRFFLISISLLLFLGSSEADEIHLKNGRIIKLDSYWKENGDIVYEKFGATMYIDQNKIKKIIKESEDEISERKSIEDEKLKSQIQKYNTNGGGVFLKNGKFFVATKTWYQDGLVYCDTEKKRLYFQPEEIKQIARCSYEKTNLKTKANPDSNSKGEQVSGERHLDPYFERKRNTVSENGIKSLEEGVKQARCIEICAAESSRCVVERIGATRSDVCGEMYASCKARCVGHW